MMAVVLWICAAAMLLLLWGQSTAAAETPEEDAADTELAKKSQNPIGDLISLPFESNLDGGRGPKDAVQYTLNVKPVYPVGLGDDWLLINRFTLPIIVQGERFSEEGSEFGLGDSVYQAFFSPRDSLHSSIIEKLSSCYCGKTRYLRVVSWCLNRHKWHLICPPSPRLFRRRIMFMSTVTPTGC